MIITDNQRALLSLVAVDVDEWVANLIASRASHASDELKRSPAWAQALASAAAASVDVEDDAAVLQHGLGAGIIKTAAQRQTEHETAPPSTSSAPTFEPPTTLSDPIISDRQFFQQLAVEGEITEEEAEDAVTPGIIPAALMALVQALPAEQQHPARMMLKGATSIRRRHDMTQMIGQMYGWDDTKLDAFFAAAAAL